MTQLAAAAKTARQAHARGRRIYLEVERSRGVLYWDLDKEERVLHYLFRAGQLKKEMIDANREFGHGRGVAEPLFIEQMANFQM